MKPRGYHFNLFGPISISGWQNAGAIELSDPETRISIGTYHFPFRPNPGDVVLDPFCGCGTAIHAAQLLGRIWLEIDITHLAISLIERRLKDAFPGIAFEVHGTPKDLDGARDLASRDKISIPMVGDLTYWSGPGRGRKKRAWIAESTDI